MFTTTLTRLIDDEQTFFPTKNDGNAKVRFDPLLFHYDTT